MKRKATLYMSDLHYGDAGQLYRSLQDCVGRAIKRIKDFAPDEIEVLLGGDTAAGRGIYAEQEMQNILQFGAEQAWFAAHDIKRWQEQLGAHRWLIVQGNHDNSRKENLAVQLVAVLRLCGVSGQYCGRTYCGNFSFDENEKCWYECEHGFGGSDYYANSYTEIRAMWRKFIERAKIDKINLSRMLLGHTHWQNVGQQLGHDLAIDTTGGWHRQERAKLPGEVRDTGVLIYLHDGEKLEIVDLRADKDILFEESRDVGLHFAVMGQAAKAMAEMTTWAHEQGLC